jgi:hypothetical protein
MTIHVIAMVVYGEEIDELYDKKLIIIHPKHQAALA